MAKETKQKAEPVKESGLNYDVRFSSFLNEGNLKGRCTVTINGEFAVKGVRVIEGTNGLFVAMPSMKTNDGYVDICNPITSEAHAKLKESVLKAYEVQSQEHNAKMNVPEESMGVQYVNEADVPAFQ